MKKTNSVIEKAMNEMNSKFIIKDGQFTPRGKPKEKTITLTLTRDELHRLAMALEMNDVDTVVIGEHNVNENGYEKDYDDDVDYVKDVVSAGNKLMRATDKMDLDFRYCKSKLKSIEKALKKELKKK